MIHSKAPRHERKEARIRKPPLSLRRGGYDSRSPSPRPGFSLIEVLLAIFILGIGVIGIAALFPAGIAQQQRSVDDIMGPIVANNALATLRTKLEQSDFGSYEDFDCDPAPGLQSCYDPAFEFVGTLRGDWLWRQPGMLYNDNPSTSHIDERGAIDIFSSNSSTAVLSASSFPRIPYNWRKWSPFALPDLGDPVPAPTVLFSRGERMFPNSNRTRNVGIEDQPQYYWDCLFRKHQGRVLVAIFVYRVTVPGSEDYVFSVPPNPGGVSVPGLPYRFDLAANGDAPPPEWPTSVSAPPWPDALDSRLVALDLEYAATEVPETDGSDSSQPWSASLDETNLNHHWQFTGQWLLDQNNNVHRVLAGRENDPNRPIDLVDPIPEMPSPNAYSGVSPYFYDRDPNITAGVENIITNLWYIPVRVQVDLDSTGGAPGTRDDWIKITPVYLTVEEL